MNPESRTAASRYSRSTFAREVYEPNEQPAQRAPQQSELERAIGRLRMEVKGEVRALRNAALSPKAPDELLAEIASLRELIDEMSAPAPKRGDAVTKLLKTRGIEGRAAVTLAKAARGLPGTPAERLSAALETTLTTAPWPIAANERSFIALVGPAGVGKTTTAAKLGARVRMQKKTVAFISCDGFRVGATGQLADYADLMGATFHEAGSPEELAGIIAKETADVVILDTSGRRPERESVEAALGQAIFRNALDEHRRVEVVLCVPAALRFAEATRLAKDFAGTRPTSVTVTKIDETNMPSALVHAPIAAKLPLSTLCFGQRVPQDIGQAELTEVVARVVPNKSKGNA